MTMVHFIIFRGDLSIKATEAKANEVGGLHCQLSSPGGSSALNLPGCVSVKVMDMGLFLAPSE